MHALRTCTRLGRCLAAAWTLVATGPALATGELDAAFGTGGELLIARPDSTLGSPEWLGGLAALSDGRVYWTLNDGDDAQWLVRMHRNGDWDTSFAGDGRVEIDAPCGGSHPVRVAVDGDGAVIWTGVCLLRFHHDGSPDEEFPAGPPSLPGTGFHVAALARDGAGRWLLAGIQALQWQVWRFRPDGSNDPSFGGGKGFVSPAVPASNGVRDLRALAVRPDDRVLLAGLRGNSNGPNLVLLQLLADGQPDPQFGTQGLVDVEAPAGFNGIEAAAVVLDRRGNAIVAGNGNNGSQSCCALVTRFDPTGVLDASFGLRLMVPPGSTTLSPFGETSSTLALLPGGQILLARTSFPFPSAGESTRTRFTLVRLNGDGSLDTGFGTAGWRNYVVHDPTGAGMGGPYSQIHGMAYGEGAALMFGRTFFEDGNSKGIDFVTLVRARFDRLFDGDFE